MALQTNHEDRLQTGDVIAQRYEIVRRLGGGAFGDVYEGKDRLIGRRIAVKVLTLDAHTDTERRQKLIERFNREARSAGSIHHPAVITIHDTGVLGDTDQPFMVMEFLDGHDLHTELKRNGPLQPARAISLFCTALEALGQAHKLGIVHKDLKPENLFLTAPGTDHEALKIVDFGVAHVRNDDAGRLTAAGEFFATANYISPEYMTEQLVLPQMDVYQMGLILVELLLGVPIVSDKSPTRCLMIHAMGQLEFPRSLATSPLAPIVARAVAFNHNDRYPDANAFLDDLRGVDPAALAIFDVHEPRIPLAELNRLRSPSGDAPPTPAPAPASPTPQRAPSSTPPLEPPPAFPNSAPPPIQAEAPPRSSGSPVLVLVVVVIAVLAALGIAAAVVFFFFFGRPAAAAPLPSTPAAAVVTGLPPVPPSDVYPDESPVTPTQSSAQQRALRRHHPRRRQRAWNDN